MTPFKKTSLRAAVAALPDLAEEAREEKTEKTEKTEEERVESGLLYTTPSPRD